jgi:hypothetical protein
MTQSGRYYPTLVEHLASVQALCDPPLDWFADPLKHSATHDHQVWLSPTRRTAYGVIHFSLPLPIGVGLSLRGFLMEMRSSEGEATLLSEHDISLGIQFVARGGRYTVHAKMHVNGFEGWAVYAGTLTHEPVEPHELDRALFARDHTVFDR